jgi:hypothetical protein
MWFLSAYDGVSKSFRTGRLEPELQMVQLSATRWSCIAILWVSIVSFTALTLYVTSQRVFIFVSLYFVMTQSGNFWIHPRISLFRTNYERLSFFFARNVACYIAALYVLFSKYTPRITKDKYHKELNPDARSLTALWAKFRYRPPVGPVRAVYLRGSRKFCLANCTVWSEHMRGLLYNALCSKWTHNGSKVKVKVKLSLCLTKHNATKAYWRTGGIAPLSLWPRH